MTEFDFESIFHTKIIHQNKTKMSILSATQNSTFLVFICLAASPILRCSLNHQMRPFFLSSSCTICEPSSGDVLFSFHSRPLKTDIPPPFLPALVSRLRGEKVQSYLLCLLCILMIGNESTLEVAFLEVEVSLICTGINEKQKDDRVGSPQPLLDWHVLVLWSSIHQQAPLEKKKKKP